MFRGFRSAAETRGRTVYEFKWLTKQAVRAQFDSRTSTLHFPALLPAINKNIATDMAAVIDARSKRGVPDHKRVDARRGRVSGTFRSGAFSVAAVVRGNNHAYMVKMALNIINEMFVTLQERHPEYLIEQFGASAE